MRKKIKEQLKRTGAAIAVAAIVASTTVFAIPETVSAVDNNLASQIEDDSLEEDTIVTAEELYKVANDETTSQQLNDYISLGKNINVYMDIRENAEKQAKELREKLQTENQDVLLEYTGVKADTTELPAKIYYQYKITENGNNIEKGIDVSSWQGVINWDEVKKHTDFAIVRVMDAICKDENGNYRLDEQFHRNMQECERLKIPVGVYWYSRATTEEEAKREARFVGESLAGYTLEYPTYIDVECDSQLSLDDNTLQRIITSANDEIASYHLYPAIYINNSQAHRVENLPYQLWLTSGETYNNAVSFNEFSKDNFEIVYNPTSKRTNYQYCQRGTIPGISGEIDFDYALNSLKKEIANSQEYKKRMR